MRVKLKKISQEEIDRHYEDNKDAGQGRRDTSTGRTVQTPQEQSPGGASVCGRSSRILPPPSKTPSKLKRKSPVKRKSSGSPSTPRKSIFDLDDTMMSPQPAGKKSRSLSLGHSSDNYESAEKNTPLDTEESSTLRRCYVEMRVSSEVRHLMKTKVDELKRQKGLSTSPDDKLAIKPRKDTKKKMRKKEVKCGPTKSRDSQVIFSSPPVSASGITSDKVVQSPMVDDSSVGLFPHPINENLSDNDCMIEGLEDENNSEKDLENFDEMPYIDHDNKKRKMEEERNYTWLNFAKQTKSTTEETQRDLNDNAHGDKNVHVNARVERGPEGNSKVLNDKFFDNLYDSQNDPISQPHKATEHEFIHPPPRSPSQDPPNFVIHNASTEECSDLSLPIPPKLNLEIPKKKGSKDSADILLNPILPDVSNHTNDFIIPPKVSKAKANEFKIPKMRGTKEELREQRSVPRSVQQNHKDEVRKMMKRVMDLDSWVNDRRTEAANSNQKKSHKLDDDDDKADLDDEGWRSFKTLQTDKERLEYFREQFGNQVSSDPTVNLSHQGWKMKCNENYGDYETATTKRRKDFIRKVKSRKNHLCGKKCGGCVDFEEWSSNVKEKAVDLFVESGGIYNKPTEDSVKKFALYAQGHISDGHRENQDFWGFYSEFQVSRM